MSILTADEFIAQGTRAYAIMSIAEHPLQTKQAASALRLIARQVADKTGDSLQIPGVVTDARARQRAANNNRPAYGKPRNRRAA